MATAIDEGRQAQFEVMMERLAQLQARYRGVRGELLARVREELMTLKPEPGAAEPETRRAPVKLAATSAATPTCRACGRTMKAHGDHELVCQNGHTRLLAG